LSLSTNFPKPCPALDPAFDDQVPHEGLSEDGKEERKASARVYAPRVYAPDEVYAPKFMRLTEVELLKGSIL
jgi:hypothetical protein